MEKKRITVQPDTCCGCGVCMAVCPVEAILLTENENGFLMPKIDQSLCVNCGKCNTVCPFITAYRWISNELPIKVYAAANRNDKLLENSASGGVFSGFAYYFLNNGGLVFGAAMEKDFTVKHICIDSASELHFLQGSKYTQSNAIEAYAIVKKQLELGKQVLFSGTPCQVVALKSFLGKEYDNLFTMDLICHGVGSNQMFKEDIAYLNKKYNDAIEGVSFRSKRKGWGTSGDIIFQKKIKDYCPANSPYYYYYLNSSIFRDSCYHCPFATEKRVGDITMGDFWRIETQFRNVDFDIEKGVSCLIINTDKGKQLLDCVSSTFSVLEADYAGIVKNNGNLRTASKPSMERERLFHLYITNGYDGLAKYYYHTAFFQRVKYTIKGIVPKSVKRAVKKRLIK